MSTNVNPFDSGDSAPAISFGMKDPVSGAIGSAPVGTKYTGVVTEAPKEMQARDYDTGKPSFWPDGNEKRTIVTKLTVNEESRTLWAPKPSGMFSAIKEALAQPDGSIRAIQVGDTLSVELVGFKKPEPGKAAQKIYKVVVTPGNAFADPTASATATSVASSTATAPTTDVAALLAAAKAKAAAESGLTEDQIATLSEDDRKLLGV